MKQWIFCLLFVPLIFSSCQKSEQASPLLNVIPKDAKFVMAVNEGQLIKKSGFDHLSNFSFYEQLRTAATRMGIDFEEDFLANSKKRGLDAAHSFFFIENEAENLRFTYLAGIKDQILLEQNIQKILNAADPPVPEIQDKLSYKMITADNGELVVVWNDKLLFIIGGNLEGVNYDACFRRPADESLMTVPDFKAFSERTGDIACWLPARTYIDLMAMASKYSGVNVNIPMMDEMADLNMHIYLDFNDDEIKAATVMTPKEKMDALYEKYPVFKWKLDQNMLKDFPANSYLATTMAFDLPAYLEIFKEALSGMSPQTNETAQLFEALEQPEVKAVLDALGGEFLFSVYGFAEGPIPMPLMGLSFTVNGEAGFQKLLAMIPKEMVYETGNYYELSLGYTSAQFAYKDNRVFITADEKSIATFLKGGHSNDITANAAIGKFVKTSPYLFYINLNLDDYPKAIRNLVTENTDREVIAILSTFKDFSTYMNSKYEWNASLKFSSGKENSLKQLIKLVDKFNN